MNTNKITKTIVVSFFIGSTLFGSAALAGSKQKPPVGDAQIETVWYQPILDFFAI